jgi:hypothetical protein
METTVLGFTMKKIKSPGKVSASPGLFSIGGELLMGCLAK